MFGAHAKEKTAHPYIIVDVGASSIGVGLGVREGTSAQLLWCARSEYGYNLGTDYERYEKMMYSTLLELGMQLSSEGGRIAQRDKRFVMRHARLACVIAPPWYHAGVRTALREREKSMEVTHAVLDELRAEGYQSFLKEEDTAAWLGVMGVPEPLEQIEQRTLLDGYATTVTEKRSVHSLMLHLYLSIIPQTVLEHVQDIIRRVLPNHEISFSSSMRSLLPAIAEVRSPLSKRGVLVEVSGQMTNVGIVDDGVLLAVRTIPHGTHDILRAVAPSARSLQEAASKFTTVAPTEGSGTVSSVPPELATACTEWRTAAQQAIADLCDGVLSPTHVYLTAPDGYYPVLADAMGKPYVQPVVRTERAHTVVRLAIPEGERPPIGLVADTRLDLFLHTLPR